MKSNPFELKTDSGFSVDWKEGSHLSFDQSSVDPRFGTEYLEGQPVKISRLKILGLILFVFGLLAVRLIQLNILDSNQYRALAEGNRLRVLYLHAPRGNIYDRSGDILARNEPSFELVATPFDIPQEQERRDQIFSSVAVYFDITQEEISQAVDKVDKNSFLPITIKTNLEKERALNFLAQSKNFSGFSIENVPKRVYPLGPASAHVMGYTGKLTEDDYEAYKQEGYVYNDYIGKNGLEIQYEKWLRGVLGQRLVEVDAQGIVKSEFQQKPAQEGNDLHLNLDKRLQEILYKELSQELQQRHGTKAAAVALDTRNGEVRALVSFPSFDNNLFAAGISQEDYNSLLNDANLPLFNRAISGAYPPGSTVKPILAVGGLADGVVDEKTVIVDRGLLQVPNQFDPSIVYTFRGWNPAGLGPMDIYSAIAMSSDIYFYTVGGGQATLGIDGLGPERLSYWMESFFIGKITGVDLPSEKEGLIPNEDWKAKRFSGSPVDAKWYLGDTYNMSIGQGFVLSTPLQMAVATAAIANGGTIYQPQIVSSVVNQEGDTIQQYRPIVLHENFAPASAIKIAQQGMRKTVTEGTARSLSALPVAIAGKTGTAQLVSNNLSLTHSWFTSYAPFDNPEIALVVIIEAGAEGTGAATAVTRRVYADWYGN